MSRFLLITIFSLACLSTQAQTTLPNMNFEDWQQSTSMQPYWICLPTTTWATGNPAATITGEYPTYRTTDAQNGSYAACLETQDIFGNVAAGNLFSGWFESALWDSQAHFGVPFTGKPDAFQGWYKYDSFSYDGTPDECAIYAILSRWDGSQRVEIARAELYNGNDVTEYTYFNLPFVYVNALTPDTISVVFSSSRNGASFEGAVGSKLFIDNINLF
ncbi:MAG: PCMD domain-containing protein [Bacteroidales bacterium]|nr:PCMD domain-containing protein [Bacteroidales bacterium]